MPSLNKVTIIGHAGRDPEIRYTTGGTAVANFSVATTETWKDKNGQKQEHTEWFNVSAFGQSAKFVQDYLTKGRLVYVEGSIRTDEWTDRDGNPRKTPKLNAQRVLLLDKRGEPKTDDPEADRAREEAKEILGGGDTDDVPFGVALPILLPLLTLGGWLA